jgi:hypothetical protein
MSTHFDRRFSGRPDIVAVVRNVTFIVTVYLFFAGFLYQYFFSELLGIPFGAADISVDEVLVYSYRVVADNLLFIFLFFGVATAVLIVWKFVSKRAKFSTAAFNAGYIAAVVSGGLLLFPCIYKWAELSATKATNDILLGRSVTLVTLSVEKTSKALFPAEFWHANGSGLTIVAQSSAYWFVLAHPSNFETNQCKQFVRATNLYAVPKLAGNSYQALLLGRCAEKT